MKKPSVIRSFKDLCRLVGEDTVAGIGRRLYKSIDCGPWFILLCRETPRKEYPLSAVVSEDSEGLKIFVRGNEAYRKDFIGFCSFDDSGRYDGDGTQDLAGYIQLVKDFVMENPGEISYKVFKKSVHLRKIYTQSREFREIYYEDKEAYDPPIGAIGVKMGSIVEGSDYCAGPYELFFPFSADEFWKMVEGIDNECKEAWEEANSEEEYDYEEDDYQYMSHNHK